MKKCSKMIWSLIVMLLFFGVKAYASTTRVKSRYGINCFSNEWENTTTYYNNGTAAGYMVWGYDTDLTDEDYTWTLAYNGSSTAGVFIRWVGQFLEYRKHSAGNVPEYL
jgi:hypothetical protein